MSIKATAKLVKRRERNRRRAFLVEGHKAVTVAYAAGAKILLLFHTPAAAKRSTLLVTAETAGTKVAEVTPAVMRHLTTHAHPPDVVAVASYRPASFEDASAGAFTLVLAGIADPAVAGGILAAAAAAGVTGAISLAGSTDPFAPAAVRAGVGAQFIIPVALDVDARKAALLLENQTVYHLASGGVPVSWRTMKLPAVLVVGNVGSDAFPGAIAVGVPSGAHGCGPGIVAEAAVAMFSVEGIS